MIAVADALRPLIAAIAPVAPAIVPSAQAAGLFAAETVLTPSPAPERALALRAGYAVASLDCLGASPHSPVWPSAMPVAVQPVEALPPGCDAVLPKDSLVLAGHLPEITRGVVPGENARLAGHDLRAGDCLVNTGDRLSPHMVLVLEEAGVASLAVRWPRVRVAEGPVALRRWLSARLAMAGCRVVAEGADLALVWSAESEPRLALAPGELAVAGCEGAMPVIALAPRFDGMIAAYVALVLPLIERLRGAPEPIRQGRLRRKITSSIGMSEIALFRTLPDGLDPLAVGAITLQALAQADRIALVPPDCEGYPAGTIITTWSLEACGSADRMEEDFS